jgi:ribonuclease HI
MDKEKIIVYCDGACSKNQYGDNIGGWGSVIINEKVEEHYGGLFETTSQRMELLSCIKALEILKDSNCTIEVYSDSAYLINCMLEKWYETWRENGWKTIQKKPVRNKDLWVRLLKLIKKKEIQFYKVDAHSGLVWNEKADELAQKGITELRRGINH